MKHPYFASLGHAVQDLMDGKLSRVEDMNSYLMAQTLQNKLKNITASKFSLSFSALQLKSISGLSFKLALIFDCKILV